MTTLFHGSYAIVSQPQVAHGRRNLDFGRGFYLTSLRPQAERWAQLVTELISRNGNHAVDLPPLPSPKQNAHKLGCR